MAAGGGKASWGSADGGFGFGSYAVAGLRYERRGAAGSGTARGSKGTQASPPVANEEVEDDDDELGRSCGGGEGRGTRGEEATTGGGADAGAGAELRGGQQAGSAATSASTLAKSSSASASSAKSNSARTNFSVSTEPIPLLLRSW